MIEDALRPLCDLLNAERPNFDMFRATTDRLLQATQGRELILVQTATRLAAAIEALNTIAGTAASPAGAPDVVALLRQLIRATHPLAISTRLWERIRAAAEPAWLYSVSHGDQVEVMAFPWKSDWLPHSEQIDILQCRRYDDPSPGDGMLYAMSEAAGLGWTTYQSDAQKAAVDAWVFAPPGSTTLVTLPTGGGKSLCGLLPPWFQTRGGRRSQGATLVVVPTVALALDQERQARRFFRQAVGDLSKPISRTGDTSQAERQAIEAALRDGRLPIIYTSPESLLGSRLYDVCLQAAQAGLLSRFVIDEAHLIASWGAGFRPEFQLLAAYRRRLLKATGGQLRTLLLSATVAEDGRATIEQLFSEPGKLIVIQANRLRPEIGYWFHFSVSAAARRSRVLDVLTFLPRPLILYVTRPDQAEQWERELRSLGYTRVASFTGDTDADSRRRLIRQWESNEIDVMVATSAFGLGVDKGDVRAVLHATLPENIDRFYQEVGRGGRDGYSAISLVCAANDPSKDRSDVALAYSLQPKLITQEKALPRWQGMIATSSVDGEVRWVDRDARPIGRPEIQRSERNREWNEHLLLMMQRARLIEIADAPPPRTDGDGTNLSRIPIRILSEDVFNAPDQALTRIEPYRLEEKETAARALRGIIDLVSDYASEHAREKECIAQRFAAVYENVQYACGGCPACRHDGQIPYSDPLRFSIDYPIPLRRMVAAAEEIDPKLSRRLGAWRSLNVTWQGPRTTAGMHVMVGLIPQLVRAGFQQVVYPFGLLDDPALRDKLIRALAQPDPQRPPLFHRLLPHTWITEEDCPLFPLTTVVLYPPDDRRGDPLFRAIRKTNQNGIRFPAIVNIVHEALHLTSEGKQFTEHVDGLSEPLRHFQALLDSSEELPAFF